MTRLVSKPPILLRILSRRRTNGSIPSRLKSTPIIVAILALCLVSDVSHPKDIPLLPTCPYPIDYQIGRSDQADPWIKVLEGSWNFTIHFSRLTWIVQLFVGIDVDLPARVNFTLGHEGELLVKACIPRAQAVYLLGGKERQLSDLYKFLNYCDDPTLTEVPVYRAPGSSSISFYTMEFVKKGPARRHQIELALTNPTMRGRIFNCDGNLKKFGINFKGKTLIALDGRKTSPDSK